MSLECEVIHLPLALRVHDVLLLEFIVFVCCDWCSIRFFCQEGIDCVLKTSSELAAAQKSLFEKSLFGLSSIHIQPVQRAQDFIKIFSYACKCSLLPFINVG